ncbi:cell division protein FtsL [Thiohalorhabdus denitrificans]|uniref:cell division protein FtsL n=1 Tax=Thiohalorhabdus denitrificans TaxID=381306 RepID=UPI0006D54451|nr:cell division protein FtsL [Thiohalorhabdus denitrificans]
MRRAGAVAVLVALVLANAMAVVWVREEARQLDLTIQEHRDRVRALETEWGRLQLERAALGARSRVEELARERHDMHTPDPGEIWDFRP